MKVIELNFLSAIFNLKLHLVNAFYKTPIWSSCDNINAQPYWSIETKKEAYWTEIPNVVRVHSHVNIDPYIIMMGSNDKFTCIDILPCKSTTTERIFSTKNTSKIENESEEDDQEYD